MIVGKKVGLRAVEHEDLSLLRDWRNIEGFRKNFRESRELSMQNQEAWFTRLAVNPNDFMFVIERLEDSLAIGACGLLYTNWIIRSADFSFYIGHDQAYIDKDGYAEDAASLLIDYGFKNLNLNKIWMELYEFDQAKLGFFKDFGFEEEGKLRCNCFENGRYYDSYIISLLKDDWYKTEK